MTRRVLVPEGVWQALLQRAREASPHECCGVLVGRGDEVVEALAARNIAPDPLRRFLIDPADHFGAIRHARASSLSVIGAYHSHPRGTPRPSETDRSEAFADPDFITVIVAPGDGQVAGYSLREGNFVPLALVRMP